VQKAVTPTIAVASPSAFNARVYRFRGFACGGRIFSSVSKLDTPSGSWGYLIDVSCSPSRRDIIPSQMSQQITPKQAILSIAPARKSCPQSSAAKSEITHLNPIVGLLALEGLYINCWKSGLGL